MDGQSLVIPEVSIYNPRRVENIILKDIHIDTGYVCDDQGRVIYFTIDEAKTYLGERGKSLASLPLLVNIYLALDTLAGGNEVAERVLKQLNTAWDRTSTTISPSGSVIHSDSVIGEVAHDNLNVPLEGNVITELYDKHKDFFQALLGVKDIDRLTEVATRHDLVLFYWYPRGERLAMFGGGDFYYMHQHIPGLLMLFCDDEPHPRRILRGVWTEE
ncbi:MAG: hypothetical protein JSV77_11315 [Dehalococcoidales bacterium]|nr:MAG: hypothetical protein JSV77_11315 [Dehalococcoidales bacterium]